MSKLFLHSIFVIICVGAVVLADVSSSDESVQHPGSLIEDIIEDTTKE